MLKRSLTLLAALALATAPALAEVYPGTTVARSTVPVVAESGGALETLSLLPGQRVAAGEVLGATAVQKLFATQDGTVALCHAREGDAVDGAVLEIAPTSRYTVYCTVESAYSSPETQLVHSGEQLYLRCTANGTHRAVGVITAIDGAEYRVEIIGGELYIGETVYLYRDADFTSSARVGIGTVVSADPEIYEIDGILQELCVTEGETVERGELLLTWSSAAATQILSPAEGIVTAVLAEPGQQLDAGQTVAEIARAEDLCIEILVSEDAIAHLAPGQAATYTRSDDPDETALGAVIGDISFVAGDGSYRVTILPDDPSNLPLGLDVAVRLGE